jgi:small subunit ribosomal protein S2
MPYVTERWLGGMLTNFSTIRKSVKKMQSIEKMLGDGTLENITKKERLSLQRDKDKMEKVLGGISQLARLPAALYIVDITNEHIALSEARKLNVTTFAMVDTNSDPARVDFPIPSNDDATKSIAIITNYVAAAIAEGLQERAQNKEQEVVEEDDEGDRNIKNFEADADEEGRRGRRRTKEAPAQPKRRAAAPGHGGRRPAQKH